MVNLKRDVFIEKSLMMLDLEEQNKKLDSDTENCHKMINYINFNPLHKGFIRVVFLFNLMFAVNTFALYHLQSDSVILYITLFFFSMIIIERLFISFKHMFLNLFVGLILVLYLIASHLSESFFDYNLTLFIFSSGLLIFFVLLFIEAKDVRKKSEFNSFSKKELVAKLETIEIEKERMKEKKELLSKELKNDVDTLFTNENVLFFLEMKKDKEPKKVAIAEDFLTEVKLYNQKNEEFELYRIKNNKKNTRTV